MKARDGAVVIGAGAACAVCCAGPILAVLGAIGLGTVLGVVAFGAEGLLVALLVVPVGLRRRRRRCGDSAANAAAAPKCDCHDYLHRASRPPRGGAARARRSAVRPRGRS